MCKPKPYFWYFKNWNIKIEIAIIAIFYQFFVTFLQGISSVKKKENIFTSIF